MKLKALLKPLFLFCCLTLVSACSDPKLQLLDDDATILAFGDSLTYGVGAGRGGAYPQVLSELIGREVVNAGVSGETTTGGLTRFESVLDRHRPDLVILMEGGNDILRNHNQNKTKSNLAQMIRQAQGREIPVILIGVPEKKLFSDAAPFYAELAGEYDLVFDGETLSDLLRDNRFKSDPIHLNTAGYREFAKALQILLQDNGAL